MRINSRRVEKSADFSALVTPRDSRTSKSAVSDRPLPITRLSIITARKRRGEGGNKKKRGMANPFHRPIHFFHLSHSQEFFNIRYTSLGMLPRIDIPFRRGGIERPWRRCTDHRRTRMEGKRAREKKIKERAERCDETVVYLYRRPYQPSRYMNWHP